MGEQGGEVSTSVRDPGGKGGSLHPGLGGRKWLAAFGALLAASFLGDLAVGPTRALLPVYAEAVLARSPGFTSMMLSAQLVFTAIAAFTGGARGAPQRVLLLGSTGPLLGFPDPLPGGSRSGVCRPYQPGGVGGRHT